MRESPKHTFFSNTNRYQEIIVNNSPENDKLNFFSLLPEELIDNIFKYFSLKGKLTASSASKYLYQYLSSRPISQKI